MLISSRAPRLCDHCPQEILATQTAQYFYIDVYSLTQIAERLINLKFKVAFYRESNRAFGNELRFYISTRHTIATLSFINKYRQTCPLKTPVFLNRNSNMCCWARVWIFFHLTLMDLFFLRIPKIGFIVPV